MCGILLSDPFHLFGNLMFFVIAVTSLYLRSANSFSILTVICINFSLGAFAVFRDAIGCYFDN